MHTLWRAALVVSAMLLLALPAKAQTINCNFPYSFVNGVVADADQVNANFTAAQTCIQSALGQIKPGGWVNVLRNASLSQWYSGLSGTGLGWTAEGVYCIQSGGTGVLGWARVTNPLSAPRGIYGLKLWNTSSPAGGLRCRFVIESHDAIRIAGQTVTFQIPYLNMTGSTVTPTITTAFPSAQDNWTTTTTDLLTTNMSSCSDGSTCKAAYTFAASASAINGYEVTINLPNTGIGSTAYTVFGGGFDLRATPGVPVGPNASPPTGEIRAIADELLWNQRFFETSYNTDIAPGTASLPGSDLAVSAANGAGVGGRNTRFRAVKACALPTISTYSPQTGAAGKIHDAVNVADVNSTVSGVGTSGFWWQGTPSVGTSVVFEMHWVADCRNVGG